MAAMILPWASCPWWVIGLGWIRSLKDNEDPFDFGFLGIFTIPKRAQKTKNCQVYGLDLRFEKSIASLDLQPKGTRNVDN